MTHVEPGDAYEEMRNIEARMHGSCDWGNCNRPAHSIRDGLPVCDECAAKADEQMEPQSLTAVTRRKIRQLEDGDLTAGKDRQVLITGEHIREAECRVEHLKDRYLQERGWKHTCDCPGSIWLWVKEIDGTRWSGNTDTAFYIEESLEFGC